MFRWLTEWTHDILVWSRVLLEALEDIAHLTEDDSWQAMQDILSEYEITSCPQEIWDAIAHYFPDLIDEVNDLRLRVHNEGSHPDD